MRNNAAKEASGDESFRKTRQNRPREASITKPFSRAGTEPQFAELLEDPLTKLIMRRDRITEHEVRAAVEIARRALPRRYEALPIARQWDGFRR